MGLRTYSQADDQVEIVVACDPAVRAANPIGADGADPLERYAETLDLDSIVVPPDATRITLRVLRERDFNLGPKRAGRLPLRGQMLALRRDRSMRGLARTSTASIDDLVDASVAFVEGLSDADYEALTAFEAWTARTHVEAARLGVVSISDWPDLAPSGAGYPIEDVLEDVERAGISPATFAEQIAHAVGGLCTLGKALRRSSTSPSGDTTSGRAPGRASEGAAPQPATSSTATPSGDSSPASTVASA